MGGVVVEQDPRGDDGGDDERPRPPPSAEEIGARRGEDERHHVEGVAVLDEVAELAAVEGRGDEQDRGHGEEQDRRDGVGGALARGRQRVEDPGARGEEGDDPGGQDEQRQVRPHARQRPGRERVPREEHVVVARDPPDAAGGRQGGDDEDADDGARRERSVLADHRAGAGEAAQPPELVHDDAGRERGREDHELRAREDRDRDRDERHQVGPPRRSRHRAHAREHGPREDRVGERLGHQEERVDRPRRGDRERGGKVGARPARAGGARQQEGGDRGARHQEGVEPVGQGEGGRRRQQPVQRRQEQRVHGRELREALAVDGREVASAIRRCAGRA